MAREDEEAGIEGQGSDEGTIERDEVSTEEEREAAAAMGWVDRPDFRGDGGAQWKTAHEFLEHGREVMPILKKNNETLRGELAAERRERLRMEAEIRAQATALKAIRDAQEEDSAANLEARKAELKDELAQAVADGDGGKVAEITEQLVELGQNQARAKSVNGEERTAAAAASTPAIAPEVQEFVRENSWYVSGPTEVGQPGKDARRTRMVNLVAAEMREAGDTRTGKAFLDAVLVEVNKTLPDPAASRRTPNRVEGSRGGAGAGTASGGKEGRYADLPPEAKAQCEKDIKSLVGPNKKHKTPESYRRRYAEIFFSE